MGDMGAIEVMATVEIDSIIESLVDCGDCIDFVLKLDEEMNDTEFTADLIYGLIEKSKDDLDPGDVFKIQKLLFGFDVDCKKKKRGDD